MTAARHVVLMGLMGSGKTTVGRLLAVRLGWPFIDNDVVLEARTGRSARDLADAEGVDALHLHEAEALVEALASPVSAVVAAAAATVLDPAAVVALGPHDRIYLRATPAVLAARLAGGPDDGHRPFVDLDAEGVLTEQFAERDTRYRALATSVVDADTANPEAIVERISSALARLPRRTRPGP